MKKGRKRFTTADYKNGMKLNQQKTDELVRYLKAEQEKIIKIVEGLSEDDLLVINDDFERMHYNHKIEQLAELIEAMNNRSYEDIKEIMTSQYSLGKHFAGLSMDQMGLKQFNSPSTFSSIDLNSLASIIEDTYEDIAGATTNMATNVVKTLRETLKDEVFSSVSGGRGLREASQSLAKKWTEKGIDSFTDKRGTVWNIERYASTVMRTKTMQAHNDGNMQNLIQNGFDLVQISHHGSACPTCKKYEGKIYSISGKSDKYPPLSSVPNGGPPFHPNCRHVIKPYVTLSFLNDEDNEELKKFEEDRKAMLDAKREQNAEKIRMRQEAQRKQAEERRMKLEEKRMKEAEEERLRADGILPPNKKKKT